MKTTFSRTAKKVSNALTMIAFLMVASVALNPVYAQSDQNEVQNQENLRTVKGVISDENGPLEGVNIVLKGSNQGTVTNSKGEFTFPKQLKPNDILLISYIGYETISVRIKNDTTVVNLSLNEDLFEFIGELNSNKLYKSKRSRKTD